MKIKKSILTTIIITIFMITGLNSEIFAQKETKYSECKIKVHATCPSCKQKIEKNIAFEKGVKDISVDIKTQTTIIKYKADKNTPENLLKAIKKLGYKAELLKNDNNDGIRINDSCDEPCKSSGCSGECSGCPEKH